MMYCNAKLLQSGTNSSTTSDILLPSVLLKLLNKHSFSANKICGLSFKVGDRGISTATCVRVCAVGVGINHKKLSSFMLQFC